MAGVKDPLGARGVVGGCGAANYWPPSRIPTHPPHTDKRLLRSAAPGPNGAGPHA